MPLPERSQVSAVNQLLSNDPDLDIFAFNADEDQVGEPAPMQLEVKAIAIPKQTLREVMQLLSVTVNQMRENLQLRANMM